MIVTTMPTDAQLRANEGVVFTLGNYNYRFEDEAFSYGPAATGDSWLQFGSYKELVEASLFDCFVKSLEKYNDACHLDAAEAEDDFRHVMWCRKIHKTGEYVKNSSGCIAVWTTASVKALLIDSTKPVWYMELGKFEKYTGEQK